MGTCKKCGKETREGQELCDDCVKVMDHDTLGLNAGTTDQRPQSDTFSKKQDDDLDQILQNMQEDSKTSKKKKDTEKNLSTVSDVFSDAVSAISSLEDDNSEYDSIEKAILNQVDSSEKESKEKEKKNKKDKARKKGSKSLFSKRKKKAKDQEDAGEIDAIPSVDMFAGNEPQDKKAAKAAKKAEAKKLKEEAAKKKKEEAKKAAQEKDKLKKEKAAAKKASVDPKKVQKKEEAKKAKKAKAQQKKEKAIAKKAAKLAAAELENEPEEQGYINRPIAITMIVTGIVLAMVFQFSSKSINYNQSIKAATKSFDNQEYDDAYQEVYGLDIKSGDREIYDKIMTVMYVNKQLNSYNNYWNLKMYPEALDSLIKGLRRYDTYIDVAKNLGIKTDLDYVREQILTELKRKFKLSEKNAIKLANMKDQTKYSREVYDVILEKTNLIDTLNE